jgi:selenocysteine-specific translation elongation factor
MVADKSTFEVTHHFEISGRGVVILGRILNGQFRVGMRVSNQTGGEPFTISSIEFADNIQTGEHWVGLAVQDHPGLEHVKRQFPVGAILFAYGNS